MNSFSHLVPSLAGVYPSFYFSLMAFLLATEMLSESPRTAKEVREARGVWIMPLAIFLISLAWLLACLFS